MTLLDSRYRFVIVLAILFGLTACAPLPPREAEGPRDPTDSPRLVAAEIALANDDLSAAATLLRMAAEDFRGGRAEDLMLEASLIANALGEPLPTRSLPRSAIGALVEAKMLLPESPAQSRTALLALLNDQGTPLPERLTASHRQYLADAERAFKRFDEAIRWQWEALAAARSPAQRLRAEALLWQDLQNIPLDQLSAETPQAWPAGLAPWRQLALAVRPQALERNLNIPPNVTGVSPLLISRIKAIHRHLHAPRQKIALLLPQTGDLAGASQRIQNGFLAATYETPIAQRPRAIRFIDVGPEGVAPATGYREAVADGAQVVLGPLSKSAVEEIISGAEITTPLVALNRVDGGSTAPGFYQFGLAPEDEAAATAATALALGHQQIAILAGIDDWSERVSKAFVSTLTAGGGQAIEIQRYRTNQDDLSGPIRAVLNLDDADERANRLRSVIGLRVHTEAKRRSDADAIFIAALPSAARVLIPQIRFHDGLDLPVLAAAQAFPGTAEDPEQDFEGLIFAEMPWLMAGEQGRLEALGIDAFHLGRLIHILQQEPSLSYAGTTGLLAISEQGVIQRRLIPVEIRAGELQRLRNSMGEQLDYLP